jgi:hypothetical protein
MGLLEMDEKGEMKLINKIISLNKLLDNAYLVIRLV